MRQFIARVLASTLVVVAAADAAAETLSLDVGGQARTAMLERPAEPGPRPAIIMLHGAFGSGAQEAQAGGLGQLAPRNGFAAVFPDGRGGHWNHLPPGTDADLFNRIFDQHGGAPDDVAFLKTLVAELVRRGVADPKRIYLAGVSAGGAMTLRVVCTNAGLFAAIGLIITGMPEPTGPGCHPANPLPVMMVNGTADITIPYYGGQFAPPLGTFNFWPTERMVAFFRELNGCVEPAETKVSLWPGHYPERIEIERSLNCRGAPVVFYRIVGGGHDARPQAFNVAQVLIDFFRDKAD